MGLKQTIQKIIRDYLGNLALTDLAEGTVTSVEPLSVTLINTMLPLPNNVLQPINISYFYVGDRVTMLRVLNGQRYLILQRTSTINPGGSE